MSNYWAKRLAKAQDKLSDKNKRQIDRQLKKYYSDSMKKILGQFEATYNKLLLSIAEGKEPTPADLYKLDTYWQMQSQLRGELRALGEKQASTLSKQFEIQFFDIYYSIAIEGVTAFNTIDSKIVEQMINQIWVADGKSWSERIWDNTEKLLEALNANLIHCVVTGKKTTELKNLLMEQFNVSYRRAEMLVRTELAHIQTTAAAQRYQDYGLTYYEIQGNEDDSCGGKALDCHEMDGKIFKYSEMRAGVNAPPFHPNCRCGILPVVE